MNYELKVTETKNKAGKFHYQVIDENGNIISERKSNREYVACTSGSGYYFGRLDLIGKGEHGMAIKMYKKRIELTKFPYSNTMGSTPEEALIKLKEDAKESLITLNKIAYKK